MEGHIIDWYISPVFLAIGVFGNVFMLSILLRWIIKYHLHCYLWRGNNQSRKPSAIRARPKVCMDRDNSRSSVLNFTMCLYLAFLSVADLGFLVTWLIKKSIVAKHEGECADCVTILEIDIINAFKGASDIIVTLMAFNRLKSIWRIGIYNKGNKRFVSFKRFPKHKKPLPFIALAEVVGAFVFSFSIHMPFFLGNSTDKTGTCGFHEDGDQSEMMHEYSSWEENTKNCTIFLWFYLACTKCIPTILIVGLNVAIAWKMKEITKARRNTQHDFDFPEVSSLTNFEKRNDFPAGNHVNESSECTRGYTSDMLNPNIQGVSGERRKSAYNVSFNFNNSIDRMNIQYEDYLNSSSIKRKTTARPGSGDQVADRYNKTKSLGHTLGKRCTLANIQNSRIDHLKKDYTLDVQLNFNTSIQEMNNRYERNVKRCEVNPREKIVKLNPSKLGSFYGKLTKQATSRKHFQERDKEIFNKKADKTIKYSWLCISIAVMFFVLTMPANFPLISYPIYHEPFDWFRGIYVSVTNFLEVLNYSLNFYVYCIANSIIRCAALNDIKHLTQAFAIVIQKIRSATNKR